MLRKTVLSVAILAFALPLAAADLINKNRFTKVALKGYDAVAYFADGKPVKGSDEFEFQWKGAKFRFANAANRDRFAKEPEKYAPQYGGFCAWGVSRGYTAPIDPDAWTIYQGKLYLNYDKDVRAEWSKDIPGNIEKANREWPKIVAAQ